SLWPFDFLVDRFDLAEEVSSFESCGFLTIGSVSGIPFDGLSKISSNRAGRRLDRVRSTHKVSPHLDRVLSRQDHRHDRSLGHEVRQALEERTFPVNGVKRFSLRLGKVDHLHGLNAQAMSFDASDDLTK